MSSQFKAAERALETHSPSVVNSVLRIFLNCMSAAVLATLISCAELSSSLSSATGLKLGEKSKDGLPLKPSEKTLKRAAKLSREDRFGHKTYPDSVRTRVVRTTSYSHMEKEVGAPGRKNCIGGILKYGPVRSAAADWSVYPVGTKFRVKGLAEIFVIDDYGSALVGTNSVDIFHPSLRLMRKWGTREAEITIIQMGDYDRSFKLLGKRRKYPHCLKMYTNLSNRVALGEVRLAEKDEIKTVFR